MKRIASLFLCLFMLVSSFCVTGYAAEPVTTTTTEYFSDGSYMVTEITEYPLASTRATSSKSGSKSHTYYNNDDVAQWRYTIKGTFSYNGTSATATDCSDGYTIYKAGWNCSSHSVSKSGNKVTGKATFKSSSETKSTTLTLTCSATGMIS